MPTNQRSNLSARAVWKPALPVGNLALKPIELKKLEPCPLLPNHFSIFGASGGAFCNAFNRILASSHFVDCAGTLVRLAE